MSLIGPINAIALNTFRETVRDRVLYAILFFALIATVAGMVFGSLSVEQDIRILADLGVSTITVFGGAIAIFVGTNLVFKEIDRRTIFLIVTKPISRWQFILGKFLGLSLCILVITFMMGLFLSGLVFLQSGVGLNALHVIEAVGLVSLELLLVVALATFFSTFSTPLMSMIFTLALWVIAHLGQALLNLGQMSESGSVGAITQALFYCLPDLAGLTQLSGGVLDGHAPPLDLVLWMAAYIFAYVILLLSFATVIAERREFQ